MALALVSSTTAGFAQASLVGIPDRPNGALPGDPLNQDRAIFSVASFDDSLGQEWIYFNARNSQNYKYVMYMGYQLANAGNAGGACVSFSNDGLTWTVPIGLGTSPGPVKDCADGSDVHLESISAFHRTGAEIHVFGLEGDLGLLQQYVGQGRTSTYFFRTTTSDPHMLTLDGEVSAKGLVSPTIPGGTEMYYFINLDASFDPASGRIYISRVYSYPYRPTTSPTDPNRVPCSGACPTDLGTYFRPGSWRLQRVGAPPWLLADASLVIVVVVPDPTSHGPQGFRRAHGPGPRRRGLTPGGG